MIGSSEENYINIRTNYVKDMLVSYLISKLMGIGFVVTSFIKLREFKCLISVLRNPKSDKSYPNHMASSI